jgi:DNA polymerase-3 subunit alpha
MVSRAFLDGFYGRPRVDMELLRQHSEGLIALSACLAGAIPRALAADDYASAKATAQELSALFGEGNFYLELQDHGLPAQNRVNQGLLKLAQETGLPLVATNDAHYLTREDSATQDVLLCIQTGKTVDDPNRMRFETQEFYLKSEEEMRALFPNRQDAFDNTVRIAERCNLDFTFNVYHLPEFHYPEGYDGWGWFSRLCTDGYASRYPDDPPEYRQRLEYEMKMIEKMGYVDYFLIVADFVSYAKRQGIPVGPGRGSAAGAMVSYCLGITDIDPMKYNLYFERFLNPERVSMPDIDMDFCQNRRGEVIDYVTRKYGKDRVAQIVTFGTMAARAAIRDVGRALNFTYAETDTVAKLIPTTLHMTLEEALRVNPQLKALYDGDERTKKLIDTARALEGMPRNTSTHAAGVVITKDPVCDYVPLAKNDETVVTQFTMTTIEELGLLKMDFLGLRNLTVIDDAEQQIRRTAPDFSMKSIRDDDPATFAMISAGRTAGVFQLESAGITGVCVNMKPTSIEDLTAIVALYRPGPMESIPRFISCKLHPETITYRCPQLRPILAVTYGCIVYQEQVIEIFRKLGGYTLGQADNMRRAISKKKQQVILAERKTFVYGDETRSIPGAVANGVPEKAAQEIYDEILDFANYAFNKAHAVCYAKVSYDTAYLKCHYPREYMAALMTSVLDSSNAIAGYIAECRDMDIALLPPDMNRSEDKFTVEEGGIRFGLAAVKSIGKGMIRQVVEERQKNGLFSSFEDFCNRMYALDLNKRAVENLIKCGAMDCFGLRRSQLINVFEKVMDAAANAQRQNVEGQLDFFSMASGGETRHAPAVPLPDIPEFSAQELMTMEKETTGLYLTGHPMDAYRDQIRRMRLPSIAAILNDFAQEGGPTRFADDQRITIAGVVTSSKTKTTKNNSLMAYVVVEDDTAAMELLCFSRVLETCGSYLRENQAVIIRGKLSVRDEKAPQILCDSAQPLTGEEDPLTPAPPPSGGKILPGKILYLKFPSNDSPEMTHMKLVFEMFPGLTPVRMVMADNRKVYATECLLHRALIQEAKETLGDKNVIIQ